MLAPVTCLPFCRAGRRSAPLRRALLLGCLLGSGGLGSYASATDSGHLENARPTAGAVSANRADSRSAEERIRQLRNEIAYHDDLYYRDASPVISDADYDALKRELLALEAAHPEAAAALPSPSAIGDDRSAGFAKVRHRSPMLSLEKGYSDEELRAFHRRVVESLGYSPAAYLVEPKIDGMAISVTYEDGRLVKAATRGNGWEGDDVTANAFSVAGLPKQLRAAPEAGPLPDLIELRGEIYVTFEDFRAFNERREAEAKSAFSHPRSLAAGSAKLSDPGEVGQRPLSVVFFGYGSCEPEDAVPDSQQAFYERARAWGLPVVEEVRGARGLAELLAVVRALEADRHRFPYPTDGAVVKVDDRVAQLRLGSTDRAPRWALAFKFSPEQVQTRLLAITLQIGRTGRVTPVAEIEPVELGGSWLARATLHNEAAIRRMDLRIGDAVLLEKAGEIIPAIVGVDVSQRPRGAPPFRFPRECPACHSPLDVAENRRGARCSNERCPERCVAAIAHFASPAAVDIRGLGPSTARLLVEKGLARDASDLYSIQYDDLRGQGGFSEASARRLLAAIEVRKRAELWRFIYGLGIEGIGPARSRALAVACGSLKALADLRPGELEAGEPAASNGLLPSARDAVVAHFAERRHQAQALRLAAACQPTVLSETALPAGSGPVAGRSFAFTGKLPSLTRPEASALIDAAGGEVHSRISASTSYLVAGENPGSKLGEAKSRGIPVIDEAALRRMLGDQ